MLNMIVGINYVRKVLNSTLPIEVRWWWRRRSAIGRGWGLRKGGAVLPGAGHAGRQHDCQAAHSTQLQPCSLRG